MKIVREVLADLLASEIRIIAVSRDLFDTLRVFHSSESSLQSPYNLPLSSSNFVRNLSLTNIRLENGL